MTQQSFRPLFQLDVFHSYFQNDICRCLTFIADAATEQLMKRYWFKFRRKVNGLGLYSNSPQTTEQLLGLIEQATGENSFGFEIRSVDVDFNLFTALPPDWVGQLIYTSECNNIVQNNVQLNAELSGNAGTPFIGKVTLRFDDIIRFSKETGFAQFDIRYQARTTQWQYFVINRSAVLLTDPAISGKDEISFDGPENVLTASGQTALLFTSGTKLLPLSEQCIYKFDLVNRPASAGQGTGSKPATPKVIIKGLPNPNPQWVGRVTGDVKDQLSSPMYIYL